MTGIVVLALPFVVRWVSGDELTSISASYYTEARDLFVGSLFFISAFLWAYNGHHISQAIASKVASVATIIVALVPTACDTCEATLASYIHYGAAILLFLILAYFCFFPFSTRAQQKGVEGERRRMIYRACGWVIVSALLMMLSGIINLTDAQIKSIQLTYWVEFFSLIAFGVAWLVASQVRFDQIGLLVREEDALRFGE